MTFLSLTILSRMTVDFCGIGAGCRVRGAGKGVNLITSYLARKLMFGWAVPTTNQLSDSNNHRVHRAHREDAFLISVCSVHSVVNMVFGFQADISSMSENQ
jgi:hypothetical protein